MDATEFFQSWTFMAIMAGLLCFLIVFVPLGIVLFILFLRRASRPDQDQDDRAGDAVWR